MTIPINILCVNKKNLEDSNECVLCMLVIPLIFNPCHVRTLFNKAMDEGMNK